MPTTSGSRASSRTSTSTTGPGDRITCRDWFQLTLKEGLTVFRDQQFSADLGSAAVQRIQDVRRAARHAVPGGRRPTLAHPIRPSSYMSIDNFYTPTVYEKGRRGHTG